MPAAGTKLPPRYRLISPPKYRVGVVLMVLGLRSAAESSSISVCASSCGMPESDASIEIFSAFDSSEICWLWITFAVVVVVVL